MKIRTIKAVLVWVTFTFLYGCGHAHVQTDIPVQDFTGYQRILINKVKVYSNEEAAKDNLALHEKIKVWGSFSRNQLERYVNNSEYQLISLIADANEDTLIIDLDVNVRYGNRALRWIASFGAGKGEVDSILTVTDAATYEIKFRGKASSDLLTGITGGDMGSVLEKNVEKQIAHFKAVQLKSL